MASQLTDNQIAFVNRLIRRIGHRAEELASAVEAMEIMEKAPVDFDTPVDQQLDVALVEAIRQRFPEDGVISEGSGT